MNISVKVFMMKHLEKNIISDAENLRKYIVINSFELKKGGLL